MVFNSYSFLIFFVIVFIVYYLPISRKNPLFQNCWILLASYFFYGYADWRMIPLLVGATVVFYLMGRWFRREMNKGNTRKRLKTDYPQCSPWHWYPVLFQIPELLRSIVRRASECRRSAG